MQRKSAYNTYCHGETRVKGEILWLRYAVNIFNARYVGQQQQQLKVSEQPNRCEAYFRVPTENCEPLAGANDGKVPGTNLIYTLNP